MSNSVLESHLTLADNLQLGFSKAFAQSDLKKIQVSLRDWNGFRILLYILGYSAFIKYEHTWKRDKKNTVPWANSGMLFIPLTGG